MIRIATVLMTVLLVAGAGAAPATPFTLYSDVCYHRESGDILGTRIGILRLPEGRYLYLQFAEGDFVAPQMIMLVPEDLQGGQLTTYP